MSTRFAIRFILPAFLVILFQLASLSPLRFLRGLVSLMSAPISWVCFDSGPGSPCISGIATSPHGAGEPCFLDSERCQRGALEPRLPMELWSKMGGYVQHGKHGCAVGVQPRPAHLHSRELSVSLLPLPRKAAARVPPLPEAPPLPSSKSTAQLHFFMVPRAFPL